MQIGNFSEFHYKCHEEFIVQKKVKIYVFWLSTFFPTVMLAHPDTIKEVMRSNSPKPTVGPGYPFLVPWLGIDISDPFNSIVFFKCSVQVNSLLFVGYHFLWILWVLIFTCF